MGALDEIALLLLLILTAGSLQFYGAFELMLFAGFVGLLFFNCFFAVLTVLPLGFSCCFVSVSEVLAGFVGPFAADVSCCRFLAVFR